MCHISPEPIIHGPPSIIIIKLILKKKKKKEHLNITQSEKLPTRREKSQ